MKMSDANKLPRAIRRSYKITNGVRTAALFIAWLIAVILLVFSVVNGDVSLNGLVFGPICIGGLVTGLVHGGFAYKKAFANFGIVIGLVLSAFAYIGFSLAGGIFLVVDTILFIQKKPLIYGFEDKNFISLENIMRNANVDEYSLYNVGLNDDD